MTNPTTKNAVPTAPNDPLNAEHGTPQVAPTSTPPGVAQNADAEAPAAAHPPRGQFQPLNLSGAHQAFAANTDVEVYSLNNMAAVLDAYGTRGWTAVPLEHRKKKPIDLEWVKLRCGDPGVRQRLIAASLTPSPLNVGIALGAPSANLVDLDLDCPEALMLASSFVPETLSFGRTSRPQSHLLFVAPGAKTKRFQLPDGSGACTLLELRSTDAQTMFPPSVHPSGEPVLWTAGGARTPVSLPLATLLNKATQLAIGCALLRYFPQNGHEARLAVAGWLAKRGWTEPDVVSLLAAVMSARGHGADDVVPAVRSTFERLATGSGPTVGFGTVRELFGFNLAVGRKLNQWADACGRLPPPTPASSGPSSLRTELGNAERFVARFENELRYCALEKRWYWWDGTRWVVDADLKAHQLAKVFIKELLTKANKIDDEELREAEAKWAIGCQDRKNIENTLALARSALGVTVEELDADPMVLNVQNGLLDLSTGKLLPHDRGKLCTKLAPVDFIPGAIAPRFEQFLVEILPDPEVRGYVQGLAGYCLTGLVNIHVLPVFCGKGANGKTTLLEALMGLLGDYAVTLPVEALLSRPNQDRHPADLARLKGCRLAVASEGDQGRALAEGLVKQLTGGDKMAVRRMHQDFFDLDPSHKLIMQTNYRPQVGGTDEGIWRRVKLVPFAVQIREQDRDPDLKTKLQAEFSGILNWALQGCLAFQSGGLHVPAAIKAATQEYRLDEDLLGQFLAENFREDPAGFVGSTELTSRYSAWCEAQNETPLKGKALGAALKARGFVSTKNGTSRARGWRGLALLEQGMPGMQASMAKV